MNHSHQFDEQVLLEEEVDTKPSSSLVVFNDDVNNFDFVIKALVDVCNHTPEQAEQCTLIIHYNGKCSVKNGDKSTLKPMKEAICERGIDAKII